MEPLNFYGPYHFDHIDEDGKIKSGKNLSGVPNFEDPNPDKKGIYIWGFMYEKQEGYLSEPVNFNIKETNMQYDEKTMQFIPYYVGKKAGKNANGKIFQRINQHHNIRCGDATKYIRLSPDYMKLFFKNHSNFPIKIKRKRNNSSAASLISKSPGSIQYFNDKKCLRQIYPNIILKHSGRKNTDYKITEQKIGNLNLPDTLFDLIVSNNNFWFCYAVLEKTENVNDFEEYETNTFWSLNGLTISQTGCCPINNPPINIINNTRTNIFKTPRPSIIFNGY